MADYSNPELEQALRSAPVSDEVRAKAWDAYVSNDDPKRFYDAFNGIQGLSPTMKSQLRAMKFPQAAKNPVEQPPLPGSQPAPKSTGPREEPWYRRAVVNLHDLIGAPEKSQSGPEQFARAAARGALSGAEQLTSPENLAAMGAMAGGSAIPLIGQIVDLAGGAYMTVEMARNLVKSVPQAWDAYQRKDYGQLGQILGQDAADALIAKASGEHLKGKLKGEPALSGTKPAGGRRAAGAGQPRKVAAGPPEPGTELSAEVKPEPGVHGHAAAPGQKPDYTGVRGEKPAPAEKPDYSKPAPGQIEAPPGRAALPPGSDERPEGTRSRMAGIEETPVPPGRSGYRETTGAPSDKALGKGALSASSEDHAKAVMGARSLPREVLESNIGQMREAVTKEAVKRLEAANGDNAKLKELADWAGRMKSRIQDFQDLIDEGPPGAKTEKPKPGQKLGVIRGGGKPPESAAPTPESIGKKLAPAVRREQMRQEAKGGQKDLKEAGTSKLGQQAKKTLEEADQPPKKADVVEMPAKKSVEPETPKKPEETAGKEFEAGVEPGVKRIFETAKSHGINEVQLMIPRSGGKPPVKLGINLEFDTPEQIQNQISKFSKDISGMVRVEPLGAPGNLRWSVELRRDLPPSVEPLKLSSPKESAQEGNPQEEGATTITDPKQAKDIANDGTLSRTSLQITGIATLASLVGIQRASSMATSLPRVFGGGSDKQKQRVTQLPATQVFGDNLPDDDELEEQGKEAPSEIHAPERQGNPQASGLRVFVSIPDKKVVIAQDGKPIKEYSALLGDSAAPTPHGEFRIIERIPWHGSVMGKAWMGFNYNPQTHAYYGIHGIGPEHDPDSTNGCVALKNDDLMEIYQKVSKGTPVVIFDRPDEPPFNPPPPKAPRVQMKEM